MTEYIHDEWCGSRMDVPPVCDCVVKSLKEKDELISALMVTSRWHGEMIDWLKTFHKEVHRDYARHMLTIHYPPRHLSE